MGLASLILATLAFVGTHFLLSHPLRLTLIGAVGELRFTLVYSLVATLTLIWVAFAWLALSNEVPIWIAPDWCWPIGLAIMLVASILLIGSFVRNPAFPHPGAARKARAATGVFAITRHPMNWAFALWAIVHLILWGSPRNIVLDSGILILAVGGSIGQDRKKERAMGRPWLQWEAGTSFLPFAALLAGRAGWSDLAKGWGAMVGGLVFWLLLIFWHVRSYWSIV
ncbi:MAG TPA: NnrU family protein [Allosphingosinicella sp.]|nr:NnrU family protein [Allosphingosinicella sp.]